MNPTATLLLLLPRIHTFWAQTPFCSKSDAVFCDFRIASEPIAEYTFVQRIGTTEDYCLGLFYQFGWPIGVYCADISLCGLGLDLDWDYRTIWDRDTFSPAEHTCLIILDTNQNSCEDIQGRLQIAGLFTSWSCGGGGAELCLSESGTQCLQLQGNIKCDGCFLGFEPQTPPDEQFCIDSDECDRQSDICGSHGVCVNTIGSFYCHCYMGYVSTSDPNTYECVDEYPGWEPSLMFVTSSSILFEALPTSDPNDVIFNDQNFKRCHHEKQILNAERIMVVLYDDDGKPREELQFAGTSDPYNWFGADNLLQSSLWEIPSSTAIFSYYGNGFEITHSDDVVCQKIGFLKMTCNVETDCDQLKWWLDDESSKSYACGIAYSKLKAGTITC